MAAHKEHTSQIAIGTIEHFLNLHKKYDVPRFKKYWDYYRNDLDDVNRGDGQFQGFPKRYHRKEYGVQEKEVVIENDIAWRIHTLGDFMFGKPISLQSLCDDRNKQTQIEDLLNRVFESNGGISFFQNLTLLGSVYGFVDILLRINDSQPDYSDSNACIENLFKLELVEASRAIALLNPTDYRDIETYIVHYKCMQNEFRSENFVDHFKNRILGNKTNKQKSNWMTEIFAHNTTSVFSGKSLDIHKGKERVNRLGRLPVVHIQNLPQPFHYEGLSEVEPLIPLQDELNTRLSDRANRVTFQSFKMYIAKGIEGFTQRKVGPGQMWETENLDAQIVEFGGDQHSPSEEQHIEEIRQAMDKTSAVTPVSAGILRGRVGNLTSENALRLTMQGLLAKTERKRVTYGKGIESICELILHAADIYGILRTKPEERRIRINWPSPLPENDTKKLKDAQMKLAVGVSEEQVLRELGY